MRSASVFVFGPRAISSCMSMGSISDSFAITIAFSAVPPMPMPSIPGGHQPAPIVGTVFSTQSTIESEGFSMANFDFASEPPPFAASVTSTAPPSTSSTTTIAGVLSPVFLRVNAGSASRLGRSVLSGFFHARRTPSSTICCMLSMPCALLGSHCTVMPTFTNAVTMPVSWQIGRWPSKHIRELIRICAIASLAAWLCSSS